MVEAFRWNTPSGTFTGTFESERDISSLRSGFGVSLSLEILVDEFRDVFLDFFFCPSLGGNIQNWAWCDKPFAFLCYKNRQWNLKCHNDTLWWLLFIRIPAALPSRIAPFASLTWSRIHAWPLANSREACQRARFSWRLAWSGTAFDEPPDLFGRSQSVVCLCVKSELVKYTYYARLHVLHWVRKLPQSDYPWQLQSGLIAWQRRSIAPNLNW